MDVSNILREKAKRLYRKIILPEKDDPRILEAQKIIEKEKIAQVLLLGKEDLKQEKLSHYAELYYNLRKHKGITYEEARQIISQPLYYTAMMVRESEADGFVAGASHTTPDVARAAIRCLGLEREKGVVSSCFLMILPNPDLGEEGIFFFADCGIIPLPTQEQLAKIAINTALLANQLLGITPRVAMLSYSTKGSAKGTLIDKVKEATRIAKRMAPHLLIDGELQLDAAIVPDIAKIKDPQGVLKGKANILIFPNLEAGNIGYKLVQRLGGAKAIGSILQGLSKPCCDLSRGCSVEDIVDCVAITSIRTEKHAHFSH